MFHDVIFRKLFIKPLFALLLPLLIISCSQPFKDTLTTNSKMNVLSYVDPFIGTDGKGKTFPGATVPYGMIQLSPDNGRNGWDWISGYFYPDNVIAGFSHTHLSGTGAGDLYDISFMPLTRPFHHRKLDDINPDDTLISHFSHDKEKASPGFYQVYLEDYAVNVELTAALRTGIQRYTYEDSQGLVRLDLGYSRNWDKTVLASLEIVDNQTVRGFRKSTGWAKDQRTFFYTRFSRPFISASLVQDGKKTKALLAEGIDVSAIFEFDTQANKVVTFATSLSSVSTENAQENMVFDLNGTQPITENTFDTVHLNAQEVWKQELNKIEVSADHDNKVQFYTALYHSALAPRLFSDVNGQYKGPDGKIHTAETFPRYEFFSLWDTFRAQHPLKTITHPARTREMMSSIVAHYDEYGLLPVWNFQGNETDMMMGYHAVPVLADAWLKGLLDIDSERLIEMMVKSASQDQHGIGEYNTLGYVPYDNLSWNVSRTLEYAFDDYAIATVADKAGDKSTAEEFYARSQRYRQHFDPAHGLMRAKGLNGEFRPFFDPKAYHPEDYCEANAWQYSFFVPHDIEGLISLYPSKDMFIKKLSEMFSTAQSTETLPEWISGFIGQYVHGNEPAHHVPYLFRMADKPHIGEGILRNVMNELYTTKPDGLCGNEDAGQMSAWYIFSAMGFYPVNPVGGEYVFGSPEIEFARINLENGQTFDIRVDNQGPENVYVQEIWLNDALFEENSIHHDQIMSGGTLRFIMGDTPKQESIE